MTSKTFVVVDVSDSNLLTLNSFCKLIVAIFIMASIKVPEQKVILCGEYGVGKSSIFRRFTNNTFITATDRKSTLGLDHFDKIYRVSERDMKVN